MPNIWDIYYGNAKKFTIGTETAFALGISRSFKASLNNDVKLSIGTHLMITQILLIHSMP